MNIPKPVVYIGLALFLVHYVLAVLGCIYMAREAQSQSARMLREEWRNEERVLADDVLNAYLDGKVNMVDNYFLERGSPALVKAVLEN